MSSVGHIIFLDFDGVMVTDRHQEQLTAIGQSLRDNYGAKFDPACVENLRQIIDSTDADIVVTSTWKMTMGQDGICQMWDDRHLPGKVIGVTPDIDPIHRGDEIDAWLDANPGTGRYAIIDDAPLVDFFNANQLEPLFRVNECTGLDEDTVRLVINHLSNK